ncbi:hypothetical protein J3P80_24925 [Pseudomonas sp. D2-30]|uniref:dermonecrotic toxin domain-containing protein n=1 Tax=unclassified Pseudomonas TaxID=196821 RepID=UPI003DA805D4
MTLDSTDTGPTSDASIKAALLNQLLAGPTYPEVAAGLLQGALKDLYPSLDLDPYTTVLAEPAWDIVGGEIVALPTRYESLSNLLADQIDQKHPTLLIEGLHFLTRLPITEPEVHLPVRIEQIGRLINELAPAMLKANQEQQLAYWNMPFGHYGARWHELSNTLRKFWDVRQLKGWTADECAMARQLYLYPDPQDRKDKFQSHAYLVDVDAVADTQVTRLNENSLVVLIGQIDDKEVILTHSLYSGYEKFETRDALGQSLTDHLSLSHPTTAIRWRLYEPRANIFDSKACGLIGVQVRVLGNPRTESDAVAAEPEIPISGIAVGPGEAWFKQQIPDWLRNAPVADQTLFAQYMKNLSALGSSHAGETYLEDIPSIKDYASNALKTQMQSDHSDVSTLKPETIVIEITSPVVWGTFVVPFKFDTTEFNLIDLALQNLIALPQGNKTVKSVDGTELPEWVTVDYLERLITQVDIGRVYPELIKRKLLDDPTQSSRRERLFSSQLRIQLPLLALESKLKGLGDIDDRGCRYVAALMEPLEADRKVDGQAIVLRKLAFVPELQLGISEDIVANMFVIGPQTPSAGPCLLYRPLLEPQLCQFPSFSNLLYAIKQSATLRQSVLAWLPDGVRDTYSRLVFPGALPSPWAALEFVATPITSLANAGPITLSDESLGADFMPLLFKANANALVTLADKQSVSNSESRWESFKQTGWLIFNLALPYLGTTANTATWLWQILEDLERLAQDDGERKDQTKWEAVVDLLLNVALGVVNIAIDRSKAGSRERPTQAPEVAPKQNVPAPLSKPSIETLSPLVQKELSQEHYEFIHTSGALMGKSGSHAGLLASFSIDAPDNLGQPESEGVFKGLYPKNGKWYAKLASQCFEVSVEGEQVSIIKDTRSGPPLLRDERDQWRIDSRLRLKGSGSKGVRQKVVVAAQRRNIELLAELNKFEESRTYNEWALNIGAQNMERASADTRDIFAEAYRVSLQTQRQNYERALSALMEWPVFQARPDAPRVSLGYLNAQINFTFADMDILREQFLPAMAQARDMITPRFQMREQRHVDAANSMIQLGDNMIERLEYIETRFSKLKKLGLGGFEFVREYRRKMPSYTSDDLRILQLEMYRHLCLTLDSVKTMPEGWLEIDRLIDNAMVAFQTLREALDETTKIRLDEQIDALGSLTEQFTAIQEHLDYMGNEYQDSANTQQLKHLGNRITKAKERALRHLAKALDERSNKRQSLTVYEERPRSRRKFIRGRFWGVVSGVARLTSSYEETGWVEVRNPLSGEMIALFHRKETGEWVPHIEANEPPAIPALKTSVKKGKALIKGLSAFKTQVQDDVQQPDRTPSGISLIMGAHASRFDTVANAIEKALDRARNETVELAPEERSSAESLRLQLKSEATALRAEEHETVLGLIKRSPPNMSGVTWLNERNLIHVTKRINRKRIKTPAGKRYLDRYEIQDKQSGKPLWFADFHYSTFWGVDLKFLSAHLRTPEQAKSGMADISLDRLNQRQLIDRYRSEIAVDQAIHVFFPKKRP